MSHQRLRDSRDIVAALRGGRQRAGRLVVLHARPQDEPSEPTMTAPARVAVLASRRVGQATDRNRAKRLLREAARHVAFAGGQDLVLVARAACAGSTFAAVHHEVAELATAMGLLDAADDAGDPEGQRRPQAGGASDLEARRSA